MTLNIPTPTLQINFSHALREIRNLHLREALAETVRRVDIPELDRQLSIVAPSSGIALLASKGLRGELVFPTELILQSAPRLLGYYRLLFGFSQKEFYTAQTGLSFFHSMEKKGTLNAKQHDGLGLLCKEMSKTGSALLKGIGAKHISASLLDNLTLLSLGPQLRGGANVKRGIEGIQQVFNIIKAIVSSHISTSSERHIEILNAAHRTVHIDFAADPDIVIREEMIPGNYRKLIAIEVKAGADFSNIHNRLGEAEKSHQKAKNDGFVECWTVVNVDRINRNMAKRESPTTNRFYLISDLMTDNNESYTDFKNRILSLTGIPT